MNPRDVNLAATPAKIPGALSAKCLMLYVLLAGNHVKYHFIRPKVVRFIAATASKSNGNSYSFAPSSERIFYAVHSVGGTA